MASTQEPIMERCRNLMPGALLVVAANSYGPLAHAETKLAVVDEKGQAVSDFEVLVNTADQGCSRWQKGGFGSYLMALKNAQVLEVLVRADGYAGTIVRFSGKDRDELLAGNAKITLKRGKPVKLRLKL